MPDRLGPSEPSIWPIAGVHAAMLDTIASALAIARATIPAADILPASLHIAAADDLALHPLALATRALAEQLLAELGEAASSRSPPARNQTAFGDHALGALRAALDTVPVRIDRKRRNAALGDAAALIREIGLERYDLDCRLGTAHEGGEVIIAGRVPAATAQVWLLERLFERAEMFALADEFLIMERGASAWYFGRWADVPHRNGVDAGDFARGVREQEWSLVSRESLALEDSIVAALVNDETLAVDIPPRQRALARALEQSVVDVFEVTAVNGRVMTARSARDDTPYRVHEHNEEAARFAGLLLLGRLIPFEDDLWLRSPGAMLFSPAEAHQLTVLAEGISEMSEQVPTPIALEAFISTLIHGAKVPVTRKPAASARQARATLDALYGNLEELGLGEDMVGLEVPADLIGTNQPGTAILRFSLDEPMSEWAAALAEQAGVDSSGGRTRSRSGSSRKAAKKRNGRGRKGRR